jgi:hypothetical protein
MAEPDTTAEKSADTQRDVTASPGPRGSADEAVGAPEAAKPLVVVAPPSFASAFPASTSKAAVSAPPASGPAKTSASGLPLAIPASSLPLQGSTSGPTKAVSGIPSGPPAPAAPPVAPARPSSPVGAADITDKVATVTEAELATGRPVSAPSLAELSANADAIEARVAQATDANVERRVSVGGAGAANASDVRPIAAYELLARSPKLGDLVAITVRIVGETMSRGSAGSLIPEVASAVAEAKLGRDEGDTRFGNVFDVLGTGGENVAERALAAALWAHAVAESPRGRTEQEDHLAADILWLATHTAFDATSLLDRALGEDAADLWTAIAEHVRRLQRDARTAAGAPAGGTRALGRGEAIVGCAALAASGSARAKDLAATLAREVKDPVLLRILATGDHATPEEVRIEGEIVPAPRGPVATTVLAFTGLLFVLHGGRLLARLALAYRCPAEVSFSDSGVRVKTRTELLGRTLREREHVILRSGLVRVVREVRFPRAAFYAGLLSLALGSYIGVRAFVDGVRSASPSLLLVGLVIVAIGVGLDFVLGTVVPGARGRCRIAFVPRTGPTLCVGDVDVRRADDALSRSLGKR